MSKTFRRAAMSSICMLIVAVMSLTGATYAWFTSNTEAHVDGLDMSVAAASGGIEISTDAIDWVATVDLGDGLEKEKVAPVSTIGLDNGAVNFFTAELNADTKNIKTTPAEGQWIEKEIYVRNTSLDPVTVSLKDTTVTANKIGEETEARRADLAARVGIAVNGKIKVTDGANIGDNDRASLTALETITSFGIFEPNAAEHTALSGLQSGIVPYKGVKAATNELEESAQYVDPTPESDNAYISSVLGLETNAENIQFVVEGQTYMKITIYVWVEGQDADCLNDVAMSDLDIAVKFKKVEA